MCITDNRVLKINVSLEKMINSMKDRYHLSKYQAEQMYRKWANLREGDRVNFDEKGDILSFTPFKAMEKIDIKLVIDPETGETDIV